MLLAHIYSKPRSRGSADSWRIERKMLIIGEIQGRTLPWLDIQISNRETTIRRGLDAFVYTMHRSEILENTHIKFSEREREQSILDWRDKVIGFEAKSIANRFVGVACKNCIDIYTNKRGGVESLN